MCLDFEEQERIVREQRAGYAALRDLEIEEMRNATFADGLLLLAARDLIEARVAMRLRIKRDSQPHSVCIPFQSG
jgi:hypothetical protein